MSELDSFVVKFKNLWSSGRNASLLIKSVAGKAEVKLELELGDAPAVLPSMHELQQRRSRYGPARQRRKLRRAAEREAIKSSAVMVNTSEVEVADENLKRLLKKQPSMKL